MRDVPAHYIRSNEQARIPARYVILDTESLRERNKRGEVQSWALAVATFLEWTKSGELRQSTTRYETPMELWSAVSDFTKVGRRTVLYAHNLNYDLRISQAISCLPGLGWTLKDMRIDGRGSWSKWSRDKASLTLCDSASIFPVKLAQLAPMFGMTKPPLPASSEREKLFARCEADVAILAAAIVAYVNWLRTGQCGNWKMTGASQSWSHFRHSHYTHKILVHDNAEALAAERSAMHSGRCEAYRWGKQTSGPYTEYDWQNSYPRIARDTDMPTKLRGTLTAPDSKRLVALTKQYAVLAEVEVTTTEPIVPTHHNDKIMWPVGTFRTTLWDPELRLLWESGASFRVHRAWLYHKQPVLKDWAEWILSQLHDPSDTTEPWKKLILKHWSRALIGRFGMRYKAWEKCASAPDSRVYISTLYDMDSGSRKELMQVGTDIFMSGETKEIDDGCPQITSYIMSEARARLWRVYQQIGSQNVVYMDTDSLIVSPDGHRAVQENYNNPLFGGLRSKGRYRNLHIYGPRALVVDTKPVFAGMPKGSTETKPGTWTGEVWRGAKESIKANEPNIVRIQWRPFKVDYNQARRYFNGDGSTIPYELPGNAPCGQIIPLPTVRERLDSIDYPAVLTPTKTKRHPVGPNQRRYSANNTVRPMPPKVPATN